MSDIQTHTTDAEDLDQVRDGGLKGIQAVVQRQQSMPTEGDHDGLVLHGQHGGLGLL